MTKIGESKPWLSHHHIWKTESEFISWVRAGLRKLWANHPIRIEFKKKKQTTMVNTNNRSMKRYPTVAAWECSICNCLTKDIQIDHISDTGGTFTSINDMQAYAEYLYYVNDDNLRCVCKPCHDIVSYSQKQRISYNEAANIKYAIKIMKEENGKDILYFLESYGYSDCTSDAKRRKAVEAILKEYCLSGEMINEPQK